MNNTNIKLKDGTSIPRLGQGTWRMGDFDSKRNAEIEGLKYGISKGLKLIDTAEMYANGKAELIAGNAIATVKREDVFIVSKVLPQNANRERIYSSCNRSLKLLGIDYLDIYLLHWKEDADLTEVVYCMEDLKEKGKIKNWGVSNFDTFEMENLLKVPDGKNCCINQILYNLGSRGVEFDLVPWQRENKIPFMAYCPIAQGGSLRDEVLSNKNVLKIAEKYNATPIQILLSFVLRHDDFVAIPKAVAHNHIDANIDALKIKLTASDLEMLSCDFPAPTKKTLMEKV